MNSFHSRDPRWITVRFEGICENCRGVIEAGGDALYYPIGKHVFCKECGNHRYVQFLAEVHDEEFIGY